MFWGHNFGLKYITDHYLFIICLNIFDFFWGVSLSFFPSVLH